MIFRIADLYFKIQYRGTWTFHSHVESTSLCFYLEKAKVKKQWSFSCLKETYWSLCSLFPEFKTHFSLSLPSPFPSVLPPSTSPFLPVSFFHQKCIIKATQANYNKIKSNHKELSEKKREIFPWFLLPILPLIHISEIITDILFLSNYLMFLPFRRLYSNLSTWGSPDKGLRMIMF